MWKNLPKVVNINYPSKGGEGKQAQKKKKKFAGKHLKQHTVFSCIFIKLYVYT